MNKNTYKEIKELLGLNQNDLSRMDFYSNVDRVYDKYSLSPLAKDINRIIDAQNSGNNVSVKFIVGEKALHTIPLEKVQHYNNPAHDWFLLVKKLQRHVALDEYSLIRVSSKTKKDDYEMYYRAIRSGKYVSNHGAIDDSRISFKEFDPLAAVQYLPTIQFIVYSPLKGSVLDIKDIKIKFVMLLLLISLLEHHGFELKVRVSK